MFHYDTTHGAAAAPPPGAGCSVRTFQPADRVQLDRLARGGLLPGHVDYDADHIDRIEEMYLSSAREHFWVAQAGDQVIGTVAIAEIGPDIGHLHWLRVAPEWQAEHRVARRLLQAAALHAQEIGFLKLVYHAPANAEAPIAEYFHLLGFEFSRTRATSGPPMLEFYLNLYERPPMGELAH